MPTYAKTTVTLAAAISIFLQFPYREIRMINTIRRGGTAAHEQVNWFRIFVLVVAVVVCSLSVYAQQGSGSLIGLTKAEVVDILGTPDSGSTNRQAYFRLDNGFLTVYFSRVGIVTGISPSDFDFTGTALSISRPAPKVRSREEAGPSTPISSSSVQAAGQHDYLLLATNRTSTMETEMQEAADQGYMFGGVMGGETSFGGNEVVVVMKRSMTNRNSRYDYRLLATSRTSTMQREIQQAGDAGYVYKEQTVFNTTFGGDEAVVILERDNEHRADTRYQYRLLATKRTSTMQDELSEAGRVGFELVGVTVSSTTFGGDEVVAILKRPVAAN